MSTHNNLTLLIIRYGKLNKSIISKEELAEGARFELAAHGVGAGFQDRWIKPLSHPSEL